MKITHLPLKALILAVLLLVPYGTNAQGPRGREFGFGISIGDPLGASIKYWVDRESALTAYIGGSYFGAPRIGADYIWHFDVFRSQIVKMYAGPGIAIGFGEGGRGIYIRRRGDDDVFYYREDETGFAGRVMAGLNIIPRNSPIEIYGELGPLIGFAPGFGVALDAALGIRFYP